MSYSEKLKLIEKAVLHAASHLLEASKNNAKIQVKSKPDYTIVMNLDLECQKKIKEILDGSIPVLAEEDESSHNLIGQEVDYFIVDPIDGTASCRRYLGIEGGQIGFGPLAGLVEKGKVRIAVYFNLPNKTLYSAIYGEGSYAVTMEPSSALPELSERRKLFIKTAYELNQSAILFYPGSMEELRAIMHLRTHGLVENTYRLGGFANDSIRLAENFEQIQLQCRVKAWDFPATLIAKEAGLKVILDPFNKKIEFEDWVIKSDNPVLIAHEKVITTLLDNLV
jgi:fructose-1,6-bisphosphatase/inositol monophosphatase family enzyme